MSPITPSIFSGPHRTTQLVAMGLFLSGSVQVVSALPGLAQFTPDPRIINYSVYVTDSLYLPDNSGLASGGMLGSGKNMFLPNQAILRAPKITVGGNFTLGQNADQRFNVPKLVVAGNASVGAATRFADTVQIGGALTSINGNVQVMKPSAIGGNLQVNGGGDSLYGLLRLRGTYGSDFGFGPAAQVNMTLASGGPAGLGTRLQYNQPFANFFGAPTVVYGSSLPGYPPIAGFSEPGTLSAVDISGPANPGTQTAVQYTGGNMSAPANMTAYYWKCSNAGLPIGSCSGDTLLPGYYGNLTVTGNSQALLLKDGFYSFRNIDIGSNAIVAGQSSKGRTVIVTRDGMTSQASNAFIGPAGALKATGFGSGAGQFLGGTMMLASTGGNINIPSDLRIWATISAPTNTVFLESQVALFGQIFAKNVIGRNMIDFGAGAFIPFRDIPPFVTRSFQIPEKADSTDATGRAIRDTLLPIVIAYNTSYAVSAKWKLVESTPRSATGGVDFRLDSGTVNIKAGDSLAWIPVRIYDDSSYEGPETFAVRFSNLDGAGCPDLNGNADTTIPSCDAKGTIVDDELPPLVRIFADTALPEGNTGTHAVPFTVRLYDPIYPANPLAAKNAPELSVPFKWSTADASATLADNDYVAPSPKWDTIPSKGLTKSVSVAVRGDLRYENDEFFWAKVDSVRNGALSGGVSDSGWILNDDAMPTVTVVAATVQEPAKYGDTAWAIVTLQVSAPSGLPTTVWYRTQDSSARGTTDFAAKSDDFLATVGSTVVAPDSLRQTIRVAVFGDTLFEKTERFKLAIDSLRNATAATPFGIVSISDADAAPTLSVIDASVREPSTGTASLRLPIRLSRPSGLPSSFVWSTADSTAVQGLDYQRIVSDTMRIPAFVRDTFIEIPVLSDSVAGEALEHLKAKLGDLVDVTAGDLDGVGTIQDAQDGFRLTIDSVGPVAEADTVVHFVVRTDWVPAFPIRLVYRTAQGTAVPGMRYADTSGVAILPAGSRSVSIAVRLKIDSLWEPLEYFKLKLDSILGANAPVVTDSVARGWIREPKELEFTFDSPDTTVREDLAGTVPVRLRLSQPASIPVAVRLPVQTSSTATWELDFGFDGLSGDTLTVPAGNRVWTFGVPVVPDTLEEADEKAILGIAPVTTGIAGQRATWTLTILDDDHHLKVEIQTPPDRLRTNDPDWTITWTVDGQPRTPSDTTFKNEGWNCVVRGETDRFGRVYSDTNCIWLDTTPPKVEVFKITGPNPRDRSVDTTWWGDRATTRYGKDTIWYAVRDSILNADGKAWRVLVDTLFTTTNFTVDGIHPTRVSYCDSVGNCAADTGWIELKLNLPNAVGGVYLDQNRDGRIDAMIVELSEAWNADFLPTFQAPLPPEIRKNLPADSIRPFVIVEGKIDPKRFLVTIDSAFRFGVTSFDSIYGVMWESWTTGEAHADSFKIRDSVAPVIVNAEIVRVENYKDPDTLVVKPSEPLKLTGSELFEVGSCPAGKLTCADSALVWVKVQPESVTRQPDGTYKILVAPGDTGSIRPGYKVRFGEGVSDTLGNQTDSAKINWATLVEGAARPDLVQVRIDRPLVQLTAEERDRDRKSGILIRATSGKVSGDSVTRQWWEPGRGYVSSDDPTVRAICPERSICNGPTLYINRPARMIVYIYDNAGTYVMSRTLDITQADIDQMKPDQIDRLAIEFQWNHRTTEEKTVSSGVYLWRIVSYVKIEGRSSPVINTKVFRLGVKIPLKNGIFY